MNLQIKLLSLLALLTLNIPFVIGSDKVKPKISDQTIINDDIRKPEHKLPVDSTLIFKADRKKGFNFDYVIYFPKDIDTSQRVTLLVESTNTGLHDSMEYHLEKAIHAASKSSVGNFVSRKLNIPILVPVFPRSRTDWEVYTHAFDSDTFNESGSDIEQIDLQLLAMVEDAKVRLKAYGVDLDKRFF